MENYQILKSKKENKNRKTKYRKKRKSFVVWPDTPVTGVRRGFRPHGPAYRHPLKNGLSFPHFTMIGCFLFFHFLLDHGISQKIL
jgi:hypothetical protein